MFFEYFIFKLYFINKKIIITHSMKTEVEFTHLFYLKNRTLCNKSVYMFHYIYLKRNIRYIYAISFIGKTNG